MKLIYTKHCILLEETQGLDMLSSSGLLIVMDLKIKSIIISSNGIIL